MNTDIALPNPFVNGKVISKDTDPKVYRANGRRGESDFVMSRSDLMEFHRCPARWIKGFKHKTTDEMDWGSLLDATTLQPESFDQLYAITPETYEAKGKRKDDPTEQKPWNWNAEVCKAWRSEQQARGRVAVHHDDYKAVLKARSELISHVEIARLITESDRQVMCMATYQDKATGIEVAVKILIDILPWASSANWHACLADLKSGGSASPAKWEYHVTDFDLDAQAGLYLDVYEAATHEGRGSFLHPCQENYPPYHAELHILDPSYIYLGRMKYQAALKFYAQCLKSNLWPGYPGDKLAGCTLILPPARAMKDL